MRAFTNTDIIESRVKWARRVAPLSMIFLIAGLITNFLSFNQPEYLRITVVLLLLGFITASVTSHLNTRWVQEPRADHVLTNSLKKFGNDYIVFNYTGPVHHILLTPARLYVIVPKKHKGEITVNKDRFSQKFTWQRIFRFFIDEGIGSPVREAYVGMEKLEKFLKKNLDSEEIPEIDTFVLFLDKDVDLTLNEPVVTVLRRNQLKSYIRNHNKQREISAEQRNKLIEAIAQDYSEERS